MNLQRLGSTLLVLSMHLPALAGDDPSLELSWQSTLAAVRPGSTDLDWAREPPGPKLLMVRNEWESRLLLIRNRSPEPLEVSVAPQPPQHEHLRVQVHRVGSVTVDQPTGLSQSDLIEDARRRVLRRRFPTVAAPQAGRWWDPVFPEGRTSIGPGEVSAFLVVVKVGPEAAAGVERLVVVVEGEGARLELPLDLRVAGLALPRRPRLRTAYGIDQGHVYRAHRALDARSKRRLRVAYRRALLGFRISPYEPADPPQVQVAEDGAVHLDWSRFDEDMAEAVALGLTSFRLSWSRIPGIPTLSGAKLEEAKDLPDLQARFRSYRDRARKAPEVYRDPAQRELCRRILASSAEHLRARGWLELALLYVVDEPSVLDFAGLLAYLAYAKDVAPSLPRLVTLHQASAIPGVEGLPLPSAYRLLSDRVDIWCPMTPNWDRRFLDRRRRQGEALWLYTCVGSLPPYANAFSIDTSPVGPRALAWQCFAVGAEGMLYWSSTHWPEDPFEHPMTYPGANGDGSLFYPGEDGPLPSLRLFRTRDGIEEFDLLCLAREAVKRASAAGRSVPRELGQALDPRGWFQSFQDWNPDPACYEDRREALIRGLEQLGG